MHLILIGMPGAGKSHLAKELAQSMAWPTLDTDWEVIKRAGMPISGLIASEGESAFRALEAEVMEDALKEAPHIIATGGGLPIEAGAMDRLKASGLVVYLAVEPSVAIERIMQDDQERFLLTGDTASKWNNLLEMRKHIYEQAHIVCNSPTQLISFFTRFLSPR